MVKTILKVLGGLVLLIVVGAGGFFLWAKSAAAARLDVDYATHDYSLPVPFPLTEDEINRLRAARAKRAAAPAADAESAGDDAEGDGEPAPAPAADPLAGVDLKQIALQRAINRGKHLVEARYACIECHGKDFGGGTMMDAMPVARLFGPNLTRGNGSVVKDYEIADWDRAVRHGVLPNGKPAAMPSEDFFLMSDRELSDVIAYIRAQPPVDRTTEPRELGPVGTILMALKEIKISAEFHPGHDKPHEKEPPPAAPNVEFGKHLLNVCTGCHRHDLSGGPIVGGDPKWAPAGNITVHAEGLAGWTYDDFVTALQKGTSKDGRKLKAPMDLLIPYAGNMTETELRAMWAYIESVPPKPTGK